ncbi:polysaccharide biosynthesis/export family protein [Sulfurovum sp. NBC37-1]|uniref:polysaccharide biosynthesis/export family protein n=1 Tax=Sulfurovum sp. (strain NBC37-1) TaxID=387093 RepID=UPI00015879A2|nr:polysaccharide biosynthesis/export family protein [Sulfurovum sp. NBC37-1]BAF72687.1 polysaccharide export system outer membrane protein [Sulfurovum sp. NBC37-1]
MKIIYYIIAVFFVIFIHGCTGRSQYQLLQTEKAVEKKRVSAASIEYKILPQDRLRILLYKDPGQISAEVMQKFTENINPEGVLVNATGYVKLPLIGKVKVVGLTQTQAANRIEALYRKELTDPSVYVEIMNKRVYVLGEVNKQGVVKLDKEKMTLFEAIAFSGGLTDDAVRNSVVIVSHDAQKGMSIRKVDLTNYDTMNYASLMLRPNDIVYVQPDEWKKFKVASDNYTSPFKTLTAIAAPFVTLKYLSE